MTSFAQTRSIELKILGEKLDDWSSWPPFRTSPPLQKGTKTNPALPTQTGRGDEGRGSCGLGAGWDRSPPLGIAALALPDATRQQKTAQMHRLPLLSACRKPCNVRHRCTYVWAAAQRL